MVQVDPQDDSIRRFIVRHYRYDPERRERRHVVVAAFDNKREYRRCLEETAAEISHRKRVGTADALEHVSGVVLEPGYLRKQENARLIERAAAHGVRLEDRADLELPRNVAFLTPSKPSRVARLRRLVRRRRMP